MKLSPVIAFAALLASSMATGCSDGDGPKRGASFPSGRVVFSNEGRTLGYVANQYSDTVSVVDLETLSVLGNVPIGINPVEMDGPRQITLDAAREVAYVLLSYPLSVIGAHAVAHGARPPFGYVRELSLHDLTPLGDLSVDRRASAMALADDESLLAIAHFDQDLALLATDIEGRRANLVLIEPAWGLDTGSAEKRKGSVCVAPLGVVFGKDRTRAYVACTGEDSLAVVDTTTSTVLTRVPAGDGPVNKPTAVSIEPTGSRVMLSNQLTSQVVAFTADDVATEVFSTSELPGIPGPVAFLPTKEWLVPLQSPNGAVRVDAATGKVLGQMTYRDDECLNPHAATVAADGRVFMVCEGDHYSPGAIVQLDAVTLNVIGKTNVGLFPDQLAILAPTPQIRTTRVATSP